MKKQIYILFWMAISILTSCNDWFNVTSGSEIREEDHYSNEAGFQQTLIGCYIGMTDDILYGKNLSWYATEHMAHQFVSVTLTSNTSFEYRLQHFNYTHSSTSSQIDAIWAKAYNVIANANEALTYIDKKASLLDDINYHIIKGELLAIRAYMHFDILRLYGYGNWANRASELNAKYTIPYVTTLSKDATPQLSGKETIQLILADLDEAAQLLKDYDPIINKHDATYYAEVNADGFFKDRTLHLNYYAVRGLQARVYLWEGSDNSKIQALAAAEEIISAIGENGIKLEDMYSYIYFLDSSTLNRTRTSMAAEYLFGLNVSNLSARIKSYIDPNYLSTTSSAMYIKPEDIEALYEGSSSDTRFSVLLGQSNAESRGYVPLKVYQGYLGSGNTYYENKVSIIRLPEIYYIAAECYTTGSNQDLTMALKRLNTVRRQRGLYEELEGLSANEIMDEIRKEYHKEFLSEGVMFYYYKRTGTKNIPEYDKEMGDTEYVLPYPTFELQSGRIQ